MGGVCEAVRASLTVCAYMHVCICKDVCESVRRSSWEEAYVSVMRVEARLQRVRVCAFARESLGV